MAIRTESAVTLRFFGRVSRPSDVETIGFCLPAGAISGFARPAAISRRTLGVELKQTALGNHQIRQTKQGHQLRRVLCQVDADKVADGVTVIQGVLDPFVGQSKRLLYGLHAQHSLESNRRTPASLALRIIRRQRTQQIRPRRNGFEFAEQPLTLGHLALGRVLQVRKALLHQGRPSCPHQANSRMAWHRALTPLLAAVNQWVHSRVL